MQSPQQGGAEKDSEKNFYRIKGEEGDTPQHQQAAERDALMEIGAIDQCHIGQAEEIEHRQSCKTGGDHAPWRGAASGDAPDNGGSGNEPQ